ncbi:MAG: hypothetical protein AAGI71_16380 [Bacteroidota bacterium]
MFTTTKSKGVLAALALSVLVLTGCDLTAATDAFDEFGIVVELEPINTSVSGILVDAATGDLVTRRATLTFGGQDAGTLIDLYSDPLRTQEVNGGLTSFGVANSTQPSPENPLEFTVTVEVNGYAPTTRVVRVDEVGPDNTFTVRLVNTQRPPEGVTIDEETATTDASGAVAEAVEVATRADAETGAAAGVSIPEGTVFRTRGGEALTGRLTTQVTHYSTTSTAALEAVTGEFKDAETGNALAALGIASLAVTDEQGRRAGQFDGAEDLAMTFAVDADESAEDLALSSFDPERGWVTLETEITEVDAPSATRLQGASGIRWFSIRIIELPRIPGLLNTNYNTDLNYLLSRFTVPSLTCSVSGNLTIARNGNTGPLEVKVQGGGLVYNETIKRGTDDVTVNFADLLPVTSVFSGLTASVTVSAGDSETTVENVSPCGGTYTATLPTRQVDNTNQVQLHLIPNCPAGELARVTNVPTVQVFYRPTGSSGTPVAAGQPNWILNDPDSPTYLVRGELNVDDLDAGTSYTFFSTYDGQTYEEDIVVPEPGTASKRVTDDNGVERDVVEISGEVDDVCS